MTSVHENILRDMFLDHVLWSEVFNTFLLIVEYPFFL